MKVRGHLVRLVVVALIPAALLAGLLLWQLLQQERAAAETAQLDVARALSQSVDTEVRRTITALEILAAPLPGAADDLHRLRERAEAARRLHGRWSNVLLIAADGTRLFNLRVPEGQPITPGADWSAVQAAMRERRPQISDVVTTPTSGRPAVYVAVPVLRDGTAPYALVATMEYDLWTDLLARDLPPGWIAAIDDRNGVIFARSERPEAFAGKPASEAIRAQYGRAEEAVVRSRNREGLQIQGAFHTSELTGWHTLAIVPTAVLDAPGNRLLVALAAGALLVFGLAVLMAVRVARPLASRIESIKQAIAALAAQRVPEVPVTSIGELDDVGRSVVTVAQALRARQAQVDELQAQLAERAEVAERASRMKDEFLGMLGHELRNPLSAISNANAVQLMQSTGDAHRMAEIIRRQTSHLGSLVDDLLDVSRAVAGKMRLSCRDVDLAQVVLQAHDALRATPGFAEHDVRFELAMTPVHADPHRMLQLVRNLVENALKYTPPGGVVHVRTRVEQGMGVLEVADSGQGIDPALLPRLFEPFVQAPQSIERRSGGLGLGLAIAKQIAEKHGGSIQALSEGLGKGSRFVVRLPLASAVHTRREARASPGPTPLPLRIALIEDHEDARRSLAAMLTAEGHRVQEAGDGLLGLVLLQENAFDVAFIDIGLPGASGYDVMRRARASGLKCRCVALTGYGQAADRERALAAGFDEFLVKPATPDQLRKVLARVERVSPPEP